MTRLAFLLPIISLFWGMQGWAQDADLSVFLEKTPVVTLNRETFFAQTKLGQSLRAELKQKADELRAENRALEQNLENEERALTARRPELTPDEFKKLAAEFDVRVEAFRRAQDEKSNALTAQTDAYRRRFFTLAVPVLAQIMVERGAVMTLDSNNSALILTFEAADITKEAIERLDKRFDEDFETAPLAPPE